LNSGNGSNDLLQPLPALNNPLAGQVTPVVPNQIKEDIDDWSGWTFLPLNPDGSEHFHLGVWVDGSTSELKTIHSVDYELHPSFRNPMRHSENLENKFGITFWTWGMFDIAVTVTLKNGTEQHLDYYLSYDLPPDDGTNYIESQDG